MKRSMGLAAGAGWRRAAAATLLVALLTVSCASGEPAPETQAAPPPGTAGSLSGNYLAGRHAEAQRDLSLAADFLAAVLEEDPENTDLLRSTFTMMIAEGRIEPAAELARRLDAAGTGTTMSDLVLVVTDAQAGRLADARERLEGMTGDGINALIVPLLKAWVLVGEGNFDQALEALAPLDENDGFKLMHAFHAALVNELKGDIDAAEALYLTTVEESSGPSLRTAELLGGLYLRAGRPDEAKELYRRFIDERPGSQFLVTALARLDDGGDRTLSVAGAEDGMAEALFGLVSSLRQQNATGAALAFGNLALYLKPDFPLVRILMGEMLESQDRVEEAVAAYRAIDPSSPYFWSSRLRVADDLDRLDRVEEAKELLRSLAAENTDRHEPLVNLGEILRRHERFEEAVVAYDEAVERVGELQPHHWSLLYYRGIALERSKDWERAEADFLKALEFEPEQPYVLNYLGYSWVDKGMHLERARGMIEKAVELRPNDGYIVDSLGWMHYRLGEFEEATEQLERAVELRPEDPVINDHLGDAYWKVGRLQEARFQWRRALALDPEPEDAAKIERKLERGLIEEARAGADD